MEFTRRQLDAIDITRREQDMCVVAGPGSGKTTVLVERFRRLVREAGIPPMRILAITFTEKAATNMKQKLAEAFRDNPEERRQVERAYVSTVHGFCMRLLRENAIFAGVDPDYRVLDERQSGTMQTVAVEQALDQLYAEKPAEMRRLMDALASANLAGSAIEIYDAIRASGSAADGFLCPAAPRFDDLLAMARELGAARPRDWKPSQLEALAEIGEWGDRHTGLRGAAGEAQFRAIADFDCDLRRVKRGSAECDRARALKDAVEKVYRRLLTDVYAGERATLFEVLGRFDRLYREKKAAAAALDYADLEESTVRLLEESPAVRERVRAQFDQVMMDEFQDTNGLQKRLIGLVRPPDRFYAVGDINQSIYGFRHADPAVFREYRDEVERSGKPLAELTENWRSREEILRAVTAILAGAAGIEKRELVAGQTFAPKDAPSVEVLAAVAGDADRALALEAQWTARRILELEGTLALRRRVAQFGDFTVLVRNSEVMAAFATAFEETGIPYLVGRGRGFYEQQEITELVHLLRVLVNPRDEISMAAVLRSPLAGLSDEALVRLKLNGNLGAAVRLEIGGLAAGDRERLERFRALLRELRAARDYTAFDRLLLRAMDRAGYAHAAGGREAANVEKFLSIAREAGTRQTLAQFVEELELVRAADPRDFDAAPEDAANAVRIMTVHAAKGLEFPVVFLAAMQKGIDTKVGDLSFSPRWGLGARWRNPVTGEEKDDLYQHEIREERKRREAEEADRLFYVAMTRAEEHLVLSYSRGESTPRNWAGVVEKWVGDIGETGVRTIGGLPVLVRRVSARPEGTRRSAAAAERAEAVVLDAPLVRDQYDSHVAVTSVALFGNCPRRYYLERYLGWGASINEGGRASTRVSTRHARVRAPLLGTQVHALLAGLAVADADPLALQLAESFRASPLGRRVARASLVEREFDFLLAIDDVVLQGSIDLWFEDRGELVLVDYKTDAVADGDAYADQLRLYALALERIARRLPDRAYLAFLRANEAVPVDLAPLALHSTVALVRELREAQENLTFPMKPGEQCRRCPFFRDLCPAEVISLAECDEPLSSPVLPGC